MGWQCTAQNRSISLVLLGKIPPFVRARFVEKHIWRCYDNLQYLEEGHIPHTP